MKIIMEFLVVNLPWNKSILRPLMVSANVSGWIINLAIGSLPKISQWKLQIEDLIEGVIIWVINLCLRIDPYLWEMLNSCADMVIFLHSCSMWWPTIEIDQCINQYARMVDLVIFGYLGNWLTDFHGDFLTLEILDTILVNIVSERVSEWVSEGSREGGSKWKIFNLVYNIIRTIC